MRTTFRFAGLVIALLCSVPASAGTDFDRIVAFGDSLSDPGNAFVVTGQVAVRPFDPIPSAPYLIGRFHFSNGPTWVEYLARDLRLRASARPALARPGVYSNYAFGSARARATGVFDLATQVDLFFRDFREPPADALYALFIGSNDLRDAFVELAEDPAESAAIVREAIEATAEAITRMHGFGARTFLVLNLPNIANTPSILALQPPARAAALELSVQYNGGLALALADLAELPGIEIISVDVFAALNDVVARPRAYGLRNVTDSCITPFVVVGAICRRPDRYLFWDFIHPTTKGHRLLSREVRRELKDTSAPLVASAAE